MPDDAPLHYQTIQQVASKIAAGTLSPVALTRAMLERMECIDPLVKSYATVMREHALAAAATAEAEIRAGRYRGPLHGVPIAVKDLCYTSGVRTMGGTPVRKDFVPSFDATVVAKLAQAGAVLLGKLNLTEGAMAGYHPSFDVPMNPWDRSRWTGVSSSGSGVATAAGLCFGSLGSDTGGSIRYPSSANGIVGLKPTYGRVSRHGVLPLAESLDHVGPMTRSVADAAIIFDVIAGPDSNDPTSLREPIESAVASLGLGVEGLRIGLDRDYALTGTDPLAAAAIEAALKPLTDQGARVVEVRMPDHEGIIPAWLVLCASEAAAAHSANFPSRAAEYGPYFREFLEFGAAASPARLAEARAFRAAFSSRFHLLLEGIDALVCPGGGPQFLTSRELLCSSMTTIVEAGLANLATHEPPLKGHAVFTIPMNFAGTPAIGLPCGFASNGMPYGIQFAGPRLSEAVLCRIAQAYESATTWHLRHPDLDCSDGP